MDQGQEEDGPRCNFDRTIDRVHPPRHCRFMGCSSAHRYQADVVLSFARVRLDNDGFDGRCGSSRGILERAGIGRLALRVGGEGSIGTSRLVEGDVGRGPRRVEIDNV